MLNSFSGNEILNTIYNKNFFTDCVLKIHCENSSTFSYEGHRCILATKSDYFNLLFEKNQYEFVTNSGQVVFHVILPFKVLDQNLERVFQLMYGIANNDKLFESSDYIEILKCIDYFLVKDEFYIMPIVIQNIAKKIKTQDMISIQNFVLDLATIGKYKFVHPQIDVYEYIDEFNNNEQIIDKYKQIVEIHKHNYDIMTNILLVAMDWSSKDIKDVFLFLKEIQIPTYYLTKFMRIFSVDLDSYSHYSNDLDDFYKVLTPENTLNRTKKLNFDNVDYTHEKSAAILIKIETGMFEKYEGKIQHEIINCKNPSILQNDSPYQLGYKRTDLYGYKKDISIIINDRYRSISLCGQSILFVKIIIFDILLYEPIILHRVYSRNPSIISMNYPYYNESMEELKDAKLAGWGNYDFEIKVKDSRLNNLSQWFTYNIIFEPIYE